MSLIEGVRVGPLERQHVRAMWFERTSSWDRKGSASITNVLVVETDLLTDSEMRDTGTLDDLDHELRDTYDERGDIRFVPPGHYARPVAAPKPHQRT